MVTHATESAPRRVFLSYAFPDDDAAETIRKSLVDHGLEVWSSRNIEPGDNIPAMIQREINEADDVLILMSRSSTESEWMGFEAAAALAARESGDSHKRIIPVLLDAKVEAPPMLERFNYVDLSQPANWQDGLDRLAKTVQQGEPKLSSHAEEQLEREHLAAERFALHSSEMAFELRTAARERVLGSALLIAVPATSALILLLAILGVFGEVGEVGIALLGAAVGAFISPLIMARRG